MCREIVAKSIRNYSKSGYTRVELVAIAALLTSRPVCVVYECSSTAETSY